MDKGWAESLPKDHGKMDQRTGRPKDQGSKGTGDQRTGKTKDQGTKETRGQRTRAKGPRPAATATATL